MGTDQLTSTAAIYTRISLDPEGAKLGVARQEADCRALAAQLGYAVVEVYTDNDAGASTRTRPSKRRPEYERMLADAAAGRFGAVVAYSNSRLTRRPAELEGLIALHERSGVRLVTVASGEDNLSTADGRMVARIKASVDAAEVERTSERVARKHRELALAGSAVGGGRAFGWNLDGTLCEPEAELIRSAARDVLAGVPLRRIAESWNATSTTPRGNAWTHQTVRQVLRSRRLAGWRVYRGEVLRDDAGAEVRGAWTPLLSDAEHAAVVAKLATPERRTRVPRKGARRYLLTGLLRCATCGALMYGNAAGADGRYSYYACSSGKHSNSASVRGVDGFVEAVVVRHLEARELERPTAAWAGAARLAEVDSDIAELLDAVAAGRVRMGTVVATLGALEAERDQLRAEQGDAELAARGPRLTQLDAAAWAGLDTDRRRAVLETLLASVVLRPAGGPTGNRFDVDRLELVWRS